MCTQVRHCLTKLNCCTPRSSACVIGLLYTGLVFVARSYSVSMLWASRLQFSIAAAGVNRCKRLACGCAKPRLTHESSVALRQRLRICSPAETLTKLLESRVRRCQDAASCRIFRDILTLLQSLNAPDEHIPAELVVA